MRREEDTIEENPPDPPNFRATIRRGELTFADWSPVLMNGGPTGELFARRHRAGVTLADITLTQDVVGRNEAIVDILSDGDLEKAEMTLIEWARATGHRRIWLPARVVELDGDAEPLGVARVRCRSCRAEWYDGRPQFWQMVNEWGHFPGTCMVCGGQLPQWSVSPSDSSEPRRRATESRRSPSDCPS